MTASSPVTMEDLVSGLIFVTSTGVECRVEFNDGEYRLQADGDQFNTVSISSNGLTIAFGGDFPGGPTFASFTFNE